MAFDNPCWLIDGTTLDGEPIRRALGTLIPASGRLIGANDLGVTQNGTPNMSVNIAAGQLWFWGQSTTSQGPYYTRNGATVNMAIAAANPTNPRLDQVVVQVQDAAYAGTGKLCQPLIITGTPTAGASLSNLVGLGTFPPANSSAYLLAYVLVPANATSIVTADIQNVGLSAFGWQALTNGTGVTGAAYGRLEGFGDVVRLRGGLSFAGATSNFATLPAALQPAANQSGVGVLQGTGTVVPLSISGTITTMSGGTVAGGNQLDLDGITYRLF